MGTEVHFLFEQIVMANKVDIEAIDELLVLTNIAACQSDRIGELRQFVTPT